MPYRLNLIPHTLLRGNEAWAKPYDPTDDRVTGLLCWILQPCRSLKRVIMSCVSLLRLPCLTEQLGCR